MQGVGYSVGRGDAHAGGSPQRRVRHRLQQPIRVSAPAFFFFIVYKIHESGPLEETSLRISL